MDGSYHATRIALRRVLDQRSSPRRWPICAACSAVGIVLALAPLNSPSVRAQTMEPRWEQTAPLAPIQPMHGTHSSSADSSPQDPQPTHDPNVAPVGFDHRFELTPRWNPEPRTAANQQATLHGPTPSGSWVCDENSCRVEPGHDAATQPTHVDSAYQRPSAAAGLSRADQPLPAASVWEQIALHATEIDWRKMLGSLALVIGGYLGFVWLARRSFPGSEARIPREVIDVVGSVRLDPRHQLQLVRLGNKLLLICKGPEGMANVGEVTQPQEVEQLLSLCARPRRTRPVSIRRSQPTVDSRAVDPNLALEQLVQSLQQAIRRTGSHAEFEA